MSRRHNLQLIKGHRNYTAVELSQTLNVSMTTVRVWKREGLHPIPGMWPHHFAAADIIEFLKRRQKPKQPLGPGEIYSVAARKPQVPVDGIVDLLPVSATSAEIVGICPVSGRRIHRRVRLSRLAEALGNLTVRCGDGSAPNGNCGDGARTAPFKEIE